MLVWYFDVKIGCRGVLGKEQGRRRITFGQAFREPISSAFPDVTKYIRLTVAAQSRQDHLSRHHLLAMSFCKSTRLPGRDVELIFFG